MTRALTNAEKTLLRTDGHQTRLYMAIHNPDPIFKARVNQSFSADESHDMVAQVTFDTVTLGAYIDVLDGMTVFIGSSEGAYDVGLARVRGTPTSSVLYIGEGSEIDWDDNLYLTVVPEWGIWPRHIKFSADSTTIFMDYNVSYSDQHTNLNPIANLGPDAVYWLTGATVATAWDASNSFALGSSVSGYSWSCADSSAITGGTTATPTITFNAAKPKGADVKCVVTAANSKTTTSHRVAWVFDSSNPPMEDFEIMSCSGDFDQGGWQATIRASQGCDLSAIRDRAKVCIFARDWIGATEGSVGTEAGRENIIMSGWISGETIINDSVEGGYVEFTIYGPQYWLGLISGFPAGVIDTTATAASWVEFNELTVDKGLYTFLYWRTTLPLCADWYKSGDTRRATAIEAGNSSLWAQLDEMSFRTILAKPLCDRFGRLYTQIQVEYIPPGSRSSVPSVLTILETDYERPVNFERRIVRETAQVALSGVYATPQKTAAYFSLSPGHVPARYGNISTYERLLLSTQAQSNQLAALISGALNSEFPDIPLTFSGTYRVFDIAPVQRAFIAIDSSDNPRGVGYSGYILPKSISYSYNKDGSYLSVTVNFSEQTEPDLSTDGDPPVGGGPSYPFPPQPSPPLPPPPPPPPPDPLLPAYYFVLTNGYGIWCYNQYTSSWSEVTSALTSAQKTEIYHVRAQIFGTGGNIYAIGERSLFYGDVTNGMRLVLDPNFLISELGTLAIWRGSTLTVNPFSGFWTAIATDNNTDQNPYCYYGAAGQHYGDVAIAKLGSGWAFANTYGSNASVGQNGKVRIIANNYVDAQIYTLTSSDAGQSWGGTPTGTGVTDGWPVQWVRGSGYRKYICAWYGSLHTSDDDGQTFTTKIALSSIPIGNFAVHDQFAINSDGTVIMGADVTKMKISTDGGATWSDSTQTFPSLGGVLHFGGTNWIARAGSALAGEDELVWVSNDDGATWSSSISGDLSTQLAAVGMAAANFKGSAMVIKPFIFGP